MRKFLSSRKLTIPSCKLCAADSRGARQSSMYLASNQTKRGCTSAVKNLLRQSCVNQPTYIQKYLTTRHFLKNKQKKSLLLRSESGVRQAGSSEHFTKMCRNTYFLWAVSSHLFYPMNKVLHPVTPELYVTLFRQSGMEQNDTRQTDCCGPAPPASRRQSSLVVGPVAALVGVVRSGQIGRAHV